MIRAMDVKRWRKKDFKNVKTRRNDDVLKRDKNIHLSVYNDVTLCIGLLCYCDTLSVFRLLSYYHVALSICFK